jgi:hypothetical protein
VIGYTASAEILRKQGIEEVERKKYYNLHVWALYTATPSQPDQQDRDQNTKNNITNYTNYHQK